ncbi:MAG TPA: nuclear transport factor 2 family protein [Holophagaceae bacterium]|nr:nuclear transport factor 2 family protein [Holophagaceae bacterium]
MEFPDADHGETARDVEAAERAWMSAWLGKDVETCRGILDEGFVLTSATGVLMGKAEWLEKATGAFSATEFRWLSILVRKLAPDVAVAHVKSSQIATVHGRDWSGVFLMTDVWVRRAGIWKVTARQGLGPLPAAAEA